MPKKRFRVIRLGSPKTDLSKFGKYTKPKSGWKGIKNEGWEDYLSRMRKWGESV